ncbi:HNH endonuclease [Vibrio gigantis]|uniref:HNH endonuclease n=1 Tax=Vibrio gigantis TaxID=296199 RepID=A0A5M9P332_9VIBR|nr:HNH endonuclease [Vibrio gigantis]KAA8679666.1 HNH endonuclease [Vibrio gigantis]
MEKETQTAFVNRVMGLNFKSTQGKYSYCNDETKQVLFSLDTTNVDHDVILDPSWSSKGYSHSIKHINKVIEEGYDLLVFKKQTKTNRAGITSNVGFEHNVEKRILQDVGGGVYKAIQKDSYFPEELIESGKRFFEGSKKTVLVNAYERNQEARNACIEAFGYQCAVCTFDFEKKYGVRGKEFIHVHHVIPMSEVREEYEVNPKTDLIPVCPNCHAMLHRGGHTITPDSLRQLILES